MTDAAPRQSRAATNHDNTHVGRRAVLGGLAASTATGLTWVATKPADAGPRRPLHGQAALVTGAGRGLGRATAIKLASMGARIVAVDCPKPIESIPYALATRRDLRNTARAVEEQGSACIRVEADVRDPAAMADAVQKCVQAFGHLDVLVVNAGVSSFGALDELTPQAWRDVIDVNLNGAAFTIRAAMPQLRKQNSGVVIGVCSAEARSGSFDVSHYVSSKWGLIGLLKCVATELAGSQIRVSGVSPTVMRTPMVLNEASYEWAGVTSESELEEVMKGFHLMDVGIIEPEDAADAIAFLASPAGHYVSGSVIEVTAGASAKWTT